MRLIKVLISIIIIFLSSFIGFVQGDAYRKRSQSLKDLVYCLRLLENKILMGANTLPTVLANVHKKARGKVANIFKDLKDDISSEEREDIFDSFSLLAEDFKEKYGFREEDIESLMYLGKILGKTDRDDQEKNFTFIIKEIESISDEAYKETKTYEKLYRSLGILLGVGIIIIII